MALPGGRLVYRPAGSTVGLPKRLVFPFQRRTGYA